MLWFDMNSIPQIASCRPDLQGSATRRYCRHFRDRAYREGLKTLGVHPPKILWIFPSLSLFTALPNSLFPTLAVFHFYFEIQLPTLDSIPTMTLLLLEAQSRALPNLEREPPEP